MQHIRLLVVYSATVLVYHIPIYRLVLDKVVFVGSGIILFPDIS